MSRALMASLVRFALVGGVVAGLAYLAFMGLLRAGVHYLPANVIVWVIGVALNYVLSRTFTFAQGGRASPVEFGAFAAGNLIQLAIGSGIYALLIGALKVDPTLAFLCNLAVGSSFSFVFMRWVVFPAQPPQRS